LVIGFDVDGVIAKAPLRIDKFTRYHETGWNRLLSTPIGKFFYGKFRRVNKATRDVLFQLLSRLNLNPDFPAYRKESGCI